MGGSRSPPGDQPLARRIVAHWCTLAIDGIYRWGGFTGHGNGYAMAAGELIAALIRTGHHPDADLFDPDRP